MSSMVLRGEVIDAPDAAELEADAYRINSLLTADEQAGEQLIAGVKRWHGDKLQRAYEIGLILIDKKSRLPHGAYTTWLQSSCPSLKEEKARECVRITRGADSGQIQIGGDPGLSLRAARKLLAAPKDAGGSPGEDDDAAHKAPDASALVYRGIAAAEAAYRNLVAALRVVDGYDGRLDLGTGRRRLDSALDELSANEAQKMADVFIRWGGRLTAEGNARKSKKDKE